MKISLPLTPDLMVQYFKNKDIIYDVDMTKSLESLTERSMMMYLSNLGISCNFDEISDTLLLEYMTIREFVNVPILAETLANVLQFAKYGEVAYDEALSTYPLDKIKNFIELNMDIVVDQLMFLDSMFLFIYTRDEKNTNTIETSTTNDSTNDSIGFNLISLISYADFMIIYSQDVPNVEDQIYYSRYFDDYMFGGKNMFSITSTSSYFGLVALLSISMTDNNVKEQMISLYDKLSLVDSNVTS